MLPWATHRPRTSLGHRHIISRGRTVVSLETEDTWDPERQLSPLSTIFWAFPHTFLFSSSEWCWDLGRWGIIISMVEIQSTMSSLRLKMWGDSSKITLRRAEPGWAFFIWCHLFRNHSHKGNPNPSLPWSFIWWDTLCVNGPFWPFFLDCAFPYKLSFQAPGWANSQEKFNLPGIFSIFNEYFVSKLRWKRLLFLQIIQNKAWV